MATVSFGWGGATGPNWNVGRGQYATQYTNTTGGYVTLTKLTLMVAAVLSLSPPYQLAVYNSFPGYPWPYQYLGETVQLSTITVGANDFTMTGSPVVVRPGESVWLVFQGYQGMSFAAWNSAGGTHVSSTLDTSYSPGSWAPYFLADPAPLPRDIPIIAYGDNTPPVGVSNLIAPLAVAEPLVGGDPKLQVDYVFDEAASEGYPTLATNLAFMESLHPVLPELPMSTEPFPGFGNSTTNPALPQALDPFDSALPGLSFSVHKKPSFKTKISESPAGNEVRNAMQQYPRWEFTLPYEFLEDRSGADSSLKTIMGFFLARQGSFDSWLFKDPDDYLVTAGFCAVSDGLTTQFPFCREMGGFAEKVGQVDTANTINVYLDGVLVDPSLYTVTLPNLMVFDSAPAAGVLTADFQFFFACRFLEDQMDFEKFMDKLWNLQECNFRSIIQ